MQQQQPPHNFFDSKAWAAAVAESAWLVNLYRKAFPGYQDSYGIRDDGGAQVRTPQNHGDVVADLSRFARPLVALAASLWESRR